MRVPRLLLVLWASPVSLPGLLLAPFFKRRLVTRGVIVCEGADWPRRLGFRYQAITFGHVILALDELDPLTFEHELVHVRQYERWGACLIPAYAAASLWAALTGRHYYKDNHFELEARRRARQPGPE